MHKGLLISISFVAIVALHAEDSNDDLEIEEQNNLTVFGAGVKNEMGNSNGIGLRYEGENTIFQSEVIENAMKASVILFDEVGNHLYLKGGTGYLEKDFEYRLNNYTATQLKLGLALLYTDNKSYNIEIGQIESILRGLENANTTSHITFINGTYKSAYYDVLATAKNANVYGDNFTETSAGAGYYPTEDVRVGANYSSFSQNKGDYSVKAGLTYTFAKGKTKGEFSPYLNASYNASNHITTTFNYENNIANKSLHFRDEFGSIINGSDITAQKYNSTEFNKRLDENIRAKNSAPVAKNDLATVQEGITYNIDVLKNDYDPEGTKIVLKNILKSDDGFKINGEKIQFKATTPGIFKCTYEVSDSAGEFSKTDTATLTVTVTAKPKPQPTTQPQSNIQKPDAINDNKATGFNTSVKGNVLINDGKDNNTRVTSHTKPLHGTLKIEGNGNYVYTPNKDYVGIDSFTYTITGGDKAMVTINILKDGTPEDTEKPVLSSTTKSFTTPVLTALTLETITATDNVDGTVAVTISGDTVDFNKVGTYNVIYTATDSAGNVSTITHTYIVEASETPEILDKEAPIITLNGDTVMIVNVGDVYSEAGATAVDNIDGNIEVTISGNVDTSNVGINPITYTAIDKAGNKSTLTRVINVIPASNTAPVLNSVSVSGGNVISEGNNNYSIAKNGNEQVTFSANGSDAEGDSLRIVINGVVYSGNSATLTLNLGNNQIQQFTIKEYDGKEYSNQILIQIYGI